MPDTRDVIIIGSGPAGYTAAMYLARARLKPLQIAGEQWGGQLMLTTEVENYPGIQKGILGPQLMNEMREQAMRFGAEIIDKNVAWVDFSRQPFLVGVGDKSGDWKRGKEKLPDKDRFGKERGAADIYQARSVIVTTGAKARMLGIGEERLLGRGVSTCAVCDAAFYKDKVTFVVGGGDAAMEEVMALLKYAASVTLIHRRDRLKASKIMQQRVLEENKDKVNVLWNSVVKELKGDKRLEAIVVEDKNKKYKKLMADGLFIAIGHIPATEIFKGQMKLDEKGYIVSRLGLSRMGMKLAEKHLEEDGLVDYPTMTSVDGVFAAGDVVDFRYRQAVTAAGFGCMAALDVERFLTGSSQSW